ncbi:MAG: hypothetical protein LQ351_001278 [Letrouitia transgressa]|nr:MAG: hypothetical protein LQ351_001278 [Letrouitia transgressa]
MDWVALGRTQFSASIAILGRLSSAGIEPLTVAVGQAICSRIPIGVHGEKVLKEAMAQLQACSSFADVVWFGVGVQHILRTLIQTSQGSSLVALCAALGEGFTQSTSALIINETAQFCGSPQDLSPSFSQWEALIRVSSCALTSSTFGLRFHQMLKLDDLPSEGLSCVGRVFYIRQGYDFVRQCFHQSYVNSFHLGGRVEFKSMLQETFGWFAAALISPQPQSWWSGTSLMPAQKLDDFFVSLYLAGAVAYVSWTAEKCRYQSSIDFLRSAFAWIPELRQNEARLLETARHYDTHRPKRQEIVDTYYAARAGIQSQCRCEDYVDSKQAGVGHFSKIGSSPTAMSDGMIYGFIDPIQSLSDRYEKASMIHIGAGSIQVGNRLYDRILDEYYPEGNAVATYAAYRTESHNTISNVLTLDTTTQDLHLQAVVDQSFNLSFWYRSSCRSGHLLISPSKFVRTLLRAVEYKFENFQASSQLPSNQLNLEGYSVVFGEGDLRNVQSGGLIVRPHYGNMLGRCIALMTTKPPLAFVNSDQDLEEAYEAFKKWRSDPFDQRYHIIV